jgi:hypothetical protein
MWTTASHRQLRWGRQPATIAKSWVHYQFAATLKTTSNEYGDVSREVLYVPAERYELPSQLAKLTDRKALTQFLETYGRFGFRELKQRGIGTKPALYRTWPTKMQSEPLEWMFAHAATVRWCLDAACALGESNGRTKDAHCRDILAKHPREIAVGAGIQLRQPAGPFKKPVHCVSRLLALHLDENLEGERRRTGYEINKNLEGELKIFSVVEGRTLLEAVYSMIANRTTGGRPSRLEACKECGAVFLQTHDQQRFCPPRLGQTRSACQQRLAMRTARHKKRQTQGVTK